MIRENNNSNNINGSIYNNVDNDFYIDNIDNDDNDNEGDDVTIN